MGLKANECNTLIEERTSQDFIRWQVSPPPAPAAAQPTAKLLNATAREAVNEAAQGREIKYIKLFKPEGSSLGFSVVGLKSAHKGELGIYVQEIQPQGIAGKDGRLQEGDQVCCLFCFLKSKPALSSRLVSIPQLFCASIF